MRFGRSSRGTWAMKIADQTKSAPLSANAAAGPLNASRIPAMAGPAKMPTLLMVLPTTFAAVSSSGESTSVGIRAAWAGAYEPEIIVDVMARA